MVVECVAGDFYFGLSQRRQWVSQFYVQEFLQGFWQVRQLLPLWHGCGNFIHAMTKPVNLDLLNRLSLYLIPLDVFIEVGIVQVILDLIERHIALLNQLTSRISIVHGWSQ